MKEYIKTLFPFRWIYVFLFIALTTIVIAMGFGSEDPNNPIYFKSRILWYGGNVIMWFLVDKFFGLGREGDLWKKK